MMVSARPALAVIVLALAAARADAQAARPAPAQEPPYRRVVVLLRSGEVLEAELQEGHRHARLRFPEGSLELPLDDVKQVFPFSGPRDDPPGFASALASAATLDAYLGGKPAPLVNRLLVRALLREDGRAAADQVVTERRRTWLLELVRRGAVGTESAREAREALARARWRHGRVRLEDGWVELALDYRVRRGRIELNLPEGRVRADAEAVVPLNEPRPAAAADEEAERAFEAALGSAEELGLLLGALPGDEANALLLRALVHDRGRAAALATQAPALPALLRLLARGSDEPGAATAAAEALARAGALEGLEASFVGDLSAEAPWRRVLARRGLRTLSDHAAPEERAALLERCEAAVAEDPVALASLWLALGHDERVHARLEQRPPYAADLLRLLRAAGRPFDGAYALQLALDPADRDLQLAALTALEVSADLRCVEPLVDALATLEADPASDAQVARQVRGTLHALTRLDGPAAAAEWAEAWSSLAALHLGALDALPVARDPARPVEDRLAAWDDVARLRAPAHDVLQALAASLREERDPRVLESVLAIAAGLPHAGAGVGRAMADLLDAPDERVRSLGYAALRRQHGVALPPVAGPWRDRIDAEDFAPPLGHASARAE